ncbi:mucin-7 isoform X2 [Triticum aestivum]|uniref:mucin-7 isoform X2 n=1 Tax=Triticum aestivum TaxID=4565 RepID=UPI001D033C11|nr:mucin-7-like isoform X2 [Triticum aestivum]
MGLSPPSRPNISASPPTPSVAFAYCSPGATATGTRPCRTSSPAPPRGDKGAVPSTPRALPSTHRSPLAPPRSLSCPRTRHLLQIHRQARSLPLASLCHGQQAHLASPLRPQRPPSSAASTTEMKRAGTPSIVEPALCFHLRPPKAAAVVLLHRASPEPAHAHLQTLRLPLMPLCSSTSTTTPPCQSNQMTESRSQMTPLTTTTTPRVPTTT